VCQRALGEPNAVVALAVRAATPAAPEELALPVRTQYVALMLLVNLALNPDGAAAIGKRERALLEAWAATTEDPRSRSLARCALDNVAQHAGLFHNLTRRAAPGKLQLVAPSRMLATFAQLERGAVSSPVPRLPGNRRLPAALSREQEMAISAAAAAAADRAEAAAAPYEEVAVTPGGDGAPNGNGACNGHHPPTDPPQPPPTDPPQLPPTDPPQPPPPPEGIAPVAASPAADSPAVAAVRDPNGDAQPLESRVAAVEEARALTTLKDGVSGLYRALSLQPVARATAAWGKGKLGVTLSALGSLLQRAPPEAWWRLACGLHELGAAAQLLLLLAAARRNGDASGCEGVLWCIAAIAHACGGRMLKLHCDVPHKALLFDSLLPAAPRNQRLFALSALRAVSACPLSVRSVSKKIKLVQDILASTAPRDRSSCRTSCAATTRSC